MPSVELSGLVQHQRMKHNVREACQSSGTSDLHHHPRKRAIAKNVSCCKHSGTRHKICADTFVITLSVNELIGNVKIH